MIWEPFILALVLGIIVSAGLYFAYLWPSVEPIEASDVEPVAAVTASPRMAAEAELVVAIADSDGAGGTAVPAAEQPTDAAAGGDAAAGPAASPAP